MGPTYEKFSRSYRQIDVHDLVIFVIKRLESPLSIDLENATNVSKNQRLSEFANDPIQ